MATPTKHTKPTVTQVDGITIEYVLAPKMVVFSHGFGVQRDSRGMFIDLANSLPLGYGYVLFDYNDIKGKEVKLVSISEQVARLQRIIRWCYDQPVVQKVHIVGHSLGAVAVSLAKPVGVDQVILLAPPLHIGQNTRKYFMSRDGVQTFENYVLVPRRDGTTSIISYAFFDEFEATDALKAITDFADIHPVLVVYATEEDVLPDEDYSVLKGKPGIRLKPLKADHNFTGAARAQLTTTIRNELFGFKPGKAQP